MAEDITATITAEDEVSVSTQTTDTIKNLSDLDDVQDKVKKNGDMLVYNEVTSNWKITRDLVQQNIDGGEF